MTYEVIMEAIRVICTWFAYAFLGYAFVMGVLGLGLFLTLLGGVMLLLSVG
jgi:hypothetical protein